MSSAFETLLEAARFIELQEQRERLTSTSSTASSLSTSPHSNSRYHYQTNYASHQSLVTTPPASPLSDVPRSHIDYISSNGTTITRNGKFSSPSLLCCCKSFQFGTESFTIAFFAINICKTVMVDIRFHFPKKKKKYIVFNDKVLCYVWSNWRIGMIKVRLTIFFYYYYRYHPTFWHLNVTLFAFSFHRNECRY